MDEAECIGQIYRFFRSTALANNLYCVLMLEFGISAADLDASLFLERDRVIRMGVPPVRFEVLTGISGAVSEECFTRRLQFDVDGVPVNFISFDELEKNRRASRRHIDLEDTDHLK